MRRFPIISKEKKEKVEAPGIKSRLRGRKIKTILSFVVVVILAFGVLPMIYSAQSETGTVAVVKSSISKGEVISQDMFSMETIGTYGLSKNVITDKNNLLGKKALVDMVKGDLILSDKVGDSVTDPLMDTFVEKGNRLVTVTVKTNAAGLASHLEKGDIINVAYIREVTDEYGYKKSIEVLNYPELKHLEIYDTENAQTESIESEKSGDKNNADYIIQTITFIATDSQAQKLLECEYTGLLHAIFVAKDRNQIPVIITTEPAIEGVDIVE